MTTDNATLDGNWELNGLPGNYIAQIFMMSQLGNDVFGTITLSNDETQNFQIEGNNNYPNVRLDFKVSTQTSFAFNGQFTDANTVTGTLSGKFTGSVTLSRPTQM
ncbi:MAG TPA: hypothetical protein VF543_08140 [Pyrinomonadaceae bacterium]